MRDEYVTVEEASQILGVARSTVYAYVSRKGIVSQQVPGTRRHRYRRSDIERIKARSGQLSGSRPESHVSAISDGRLTYRTLDAVDVAETASFEDVACLLWGVAGDIFDRPAPRGTKIFTELDRVLADEAGADRALAHFPFIEQANPRGYDLSQLGMATTGVDIARWLTAIILNRDSASSDPIHLQFERVLALGQEQSELLRRVLVLAADHGLTESTMAVRMVARTGVTPWRAVAVGIALATGRQDRFGPNGTLRRFVADIIASPEPEAIATRQLREGSELPGFGSPYYPNGDPRAAAILAFCGQALHDLPAFDRLDRVIRFAQEVSDLAPNFALVSTFAEAITGLQSRREFVGLSSSEAPYLIGRSAGWIAHCMEERASQPSHSLGAIF